MTPPRTVADTGESARIVYTAEIAQAEMLGHARGQMQAARLALGLALSNAREFVGQIERAAARGADPTDPLYGAARLHAEALALAARIEAVAAVATSNPEQQEAA